MEKEEIRHIMLNERKNIKDKEKLSTIIVDKIVSLDIYKKAKVIALYKSLTSEINTEYLINEALVNKIVLLPRVINDEISFIKINKNTKYIKSNFGVLEPIGNIFTDVIDLIIIPGVSFDKNFNRLGFGKGYYDRYLSDKTMFKIGICFDNQLIDELPTNELDIQMDMIITDKKILKKV